MITILGISHRLDKQVLYALQKYKGIGMESARKILHQNYVHRYAKLSDLNEEKFNAVKSSIQAVLEKRKEENLVQMKHRMRYEAALKKAFI